MCSFSYCKIYNNSPDDAISIVVKYVNESCAMVHGDGPWTVHNVLNYLRVRRVWGRVWGSVRDWNFEYEIGMTSNLNMRLD